MPNTTKYTAENLTKVIKESKTWNEVCKHYKVSPSGGSYAFIKQRAVEFGIDFSHFEKVVRKFKPDTEPVWIRQYNCKECGDFEVVHSNSTNINESCGWCGRSVQHIKLRLQIPSKRIFRK